MLLLLLYRNWCNFCLDYDWNMCKTWIDHLCLLWSIKWSPITSHGQWFIWTFYVLELYNRSKFHGQLIHFLFVVAFLLETEMQNSAMGIPVSRVKGLQWRISMRQGYQKLMVRWLPSLVFLMVCLIFLNYLSLKVLFTLIKYVVYSFHSVILCNICIIMLNSGHGGSRTAEYLKNNLFKNLSNHPDFIKDTKSAIGMDFSELMNFDVLPIPILNLLLHLN